MQNQSFKNLNFHLKLGKEVFMHKKLSKVFIYMCVRAFAMCMYDSVRSTKLIKIFNKLPTLKEER